MLHLDFFDGKGAARTLCAREEQIRTADLDMFEVPRADISGDQHGETIYPDHKLVEDIAPNSFTAKMGDRIFRI